MVDQYYMETFKRESIEKKNKLNMQNGIRPRDRAQN